MKVCLSQAMNVILEPSRLLLFITANPFLGLKTELLMYQTDFMVFLKNKQTKAMCFISDK